MNEGKVYCANCHHLEQLKSFDGKETEKVCVLTAAHNHHMPYGIDVEGTESYMDKNCDNDCRDYSERFIDRNIRFLKNKML